MQSPTYPYRELFTTTGAYDFVVEEEFQKCAMQFCDQTGDVGIVVDVNFGVEFMDRVVAFARVCGCEPSHILGGTEPGLYVYYFKRR